MRGNAMGYDTMKSARAGVPLWMLAVVAVVCLMVGGGVGLLLGGPSSTPAAAPDPAVSPTATASPSGSPSPSSSVAPPEIGSDDTAGSGTAKKPEATARTFVAGWLATNEIKREKLLRQAATRFLADELMVTANEAIPRTKLTGMQRLSGSDLSAEYVATLASGDRVLLSLSPDPEASSGWLVTAVEPWE